MYFAKIGEGEKMQNSVKSMPIKGNSQFELTSNLLRNLNKFKLTPVTKLVLLELTTHLNEDKNGSVVFPSVNYIADVLGIGLTAAKKAIKDLINEGLIIKSKRSKIQGNYNKYLITPKVRNLTCEQPENGCFKKSESGCLLITNNSEQNKTTKDAEILKNYAKKHATTNIQGYIARLKQTGADKTIIQQYKEAENRVNKMKESTKQVIKDLEFAKQNRAIVPEGWFKEMRKQFE